MHNRYGMSKVWHLAQSKLYIWISVYYLTKVEFEEERRQLLELAEYNEHSSEALEEKLKENEQQLSEITASLLQREDELQQMQEKLVSVAA